MLGINGDQVASFVRSVIIGVGVYVAAKFGLVIGADNSFLIEVAGLVGAAAAALWGIWFHAGAKKADLEKVVAVKAGAVVAAPLSVNEEVKVEDKAIAAQAVK